ncbi:uncharacterized protein F5Z01DRAFT_640628 [Emericellopsis atlantica]|uniref:DUF7587 domain-containing protein n=1 Tax=Emericellopsis atlantica TaxID=2614577 RepID=A0A9P8CK72_9HYPO|nr:uncharacterized protein F5Z01DRAFT_640628 [Emericellopsis atlantica]KAG9250048.1 hypothetical protein F5Z01DRAFT_640628 [Emericellopsis atlantica]
MAISKEGKLRLYRASASIDLFTIAACDSQARVPGKYGQSEGTGTGGHNMTSFRRSSWHLNHPTMSSPDPADDNLFKTNMDADTVSDRLTAIVPPNQELQTVVKTEEEEHPWRASRSQALKVPLLRTWDYKSESRLNADNCLMSRAPEHRLDTFEYRKKSLSTHLDHKHREPTPFIPFTTSATELEELAKFRAERPGRGAQKLTVVDPTVRLAAGLPVLNAAAEMNYYGIPDPYGKSNRYYEDHYLCLWQVSSDEVVGTWDWDVLVTNRDWYDEVVMPAFRRRLATQPPHEEQDELSADLARLSVTSDHFDSMYSSSGSDSSHPECSWDTDDEAEESNAADDNIRFIEDNW